ncbi:aminopeptidase [Aliterella atlantica CENA595]|uniref:Aminopeptidase n=1 Tax=Aliterella atlantica CENA595 TaxID=1618023 RepID=A0A0D8ZSJ9_9CYAN|nr:aminopeptidase [Aliterella atlantica CENA595]
MGDNTVQLGRSLKLLVAGASMISFGVVAGCAQQIDAQTLQQNQNSDVRALVNFGPRASGTQATEKASNYLQQQYRQAGYEVKVQTFTYPKFTDLGSNLTVDGKTIEGIALNGSQAGTPNARLVVVPNAGREADFAAVDAKGAIAIVKRGEIRFLNKAQNAVKAGAVGLVIVNTEPGNFYGTLGGDVQIPVLGLSGKSGSSLLQANQLRQANLAVNTRQGNVTGRNTIAHLPGVTQPKVILGGHYDSVVDSPGANDNASGTAAVLAIARQAAKTPLARQAWFVAFDGEEDGLHGSRAFVSQARPEFLKGLKGMLNFDMVGINDRLLVGGTESLTKLAKTTAPQVSTFGSRGGSDHAPFASAGVPVLFFYRGQDPNYHQPGDKQVDARLIDETARLGFNLASKISSQ